MQLLRSPDQGGGKCLEWPQFPSVVGAWKLIDVKAVTWEQQFGGIGKGWEAVYEHARCGCQKLTFTNNLLLYGAKFIQKTIAADLVGHERYAAAQGLNEHA